MSRVHDMGGRFGDGAIKGEDDAVFAEDWHARALALTLAAGALGQWNIDTSRHARERLSPKDYTRFSYYEKWMGGLAELLVETGVVTRNELATLTPEGVSDLAERKLLAENVAAALAAGGPADRPSDKTPDFQRGDRVKLRARAGNVLVRGGHTRLPSYAAGAVGEIVIYHGTHVLPDSSAHGLGDAAEPLYAVAIKAADLWDHPENPNDEVILDLWQSYLERA
ncbi:nitrile hydratase subunit beta [Cognatishimia sp.]|uniref:nitrile hydratase subunit beta n=1 Tax=Cognatishimia sp. TaxID=2211648 RepID=UPI0035124231